MEDKLAAKLKEYFQKLDAVKIAVYASLLIIIVLAVYLRAYHIDYPTVGYHNMKEDEFMSFALNMQGSGDYLRTTWFDCSISTNDYYGDPYRRCNFNEGETPLSVWMLMLFLAIFGWKLAVARSFIILFSVGTIIIIYMLVRRLSGKEYLAVLSSLFYAIIPLSIFFGRNIQMDSPSLFFALCTLYLFLKWIDTRSRRTLIYAAILFIITAWFKITSLIVLFPLVLLFPYKDFFMHYKKNYKEYAILVGMFIISISWIMFVAPALMPTTNVVGLSTGASFGEYNWVDLTFSIFTHEYWVNFKPIIMSYMNDNYSMTGLWIVFLGFALFLLKFRSVLSKFMIGYAIGIIIYIILFAYKWNAHNYYQFPFLAFAAICMANVIFQAGMIIKSATGIKYLQFASVLLILLLIAPFKQSTMQQFNTQFFGQDIAGTYINTHTSPGEIFLLERGIQHQVSWTARRFYYSIPENETELKRIEDEKGLRYIVLTNYGVSVAQQKPIWNYIKENYKIAQVGFIQSQQGPQVYHLVLEKGGKFDYNSLNTLPARQVSTYELSYVDVPYYVIEAN